MKVHIKPLSVVRNNLKDIRPKYQGNIALQKI